MYTVSELCHKLSYELCPMEYSRMHVMYHYCLLDYMCVIVAIIESMPLKYDMTQNSFVSVPLMEAMWCNYVTLEYISGTRCRG